MSNHRNQTSVYPLISGLFIGALCVALWMKFTHQPSGDLNSQSSSVNTGKASGADHLNDSVGQVGAGTSAAFKLSNDNTQQVNDSKTSASDASGSSSLSHATDGPASQLAGPSIAADLDGSFVQAYELLPQAEGQLPPTALLQQTWNYGHLTDSGGIVLLKSGKLVTWDVSLPGGLFELKVTSKLLKLKGTPQEAIALDQQNQVWRIATRGESIFEIIRNDCHDIFFSSHAGKALIKTAVGELVVLDLNRPSSGKLISAPPGVNVSEAVLTASTSVWVAAGQLWRLDLRYGGWQQQPSRGDEVSPMGDGAIIFNEEGYLYSVGGADPPPDLPATRLFAATNGIAVSMDHDRNATVWGSRLPEGVRKIKLSPTTNNILLGPSGLLLAW